MGRTVAVVWHASFSLAAGVLYFFFALPRTPELLGQTSHPLGTALRIVTGALIGLAALPVVFTLVRTRRPEFGTPQLALNLRTSSIVLHVLAGALIIGTAISEIWLSLNDAGQWLFGIYGGAAAIAALGVSAFYLAFIAELPPPPPKPVKVKQRATRRGHTGDADQAEPADEDTAANAADAADAADDEAAESEAEVVAESAPATDTDRDADDDTTADTSGDDADNDSPEPSDGKLQNRHPAGKGSVLGRRKRIRGGVAVED
ncbi:hypothetical protein JDV09_03300 [Mycobacterium sp. Y57]|uniref:hypothetical protein n=1 Tax=Mycolicibacterium xanthum TaxID=2796469 RepID=UPI001C851963|nr:hypothetical protein [Mycolicibacterium xanthum]MBX7431141.1 hypothetical protein [Mycolicibacterium xanthum]